MDRRRKLDEQVRPRSGAGHVLFVWLPVMVMLGVIARESTEGFAAVNTSPMLRPVWEMISGKMSDTRWEAVHHMIRKTGHFVGYGLVGLSFLRAFLWTWLWPLRLMPSRVWVRWSVQMALAATALAASLDELHQSFLPDRTGVVQDVLLDSAGAVVLCGVVVAGGLILSHRQSTVRAV